MMNDIVKTFSKAVVVTQFSDYYKARSKIPDQEDRRQKLLADQKRKRSELHDKARGLIDLEDEAGGEDEDFSKDYWSPKTSQRQRKLEYAEVLMMSEWLIEIPSDLDSNWYIVPCPVGKRTLVVSSKQGTRVYDKRGYPLASFKSMLPEGTILDCIWSKKQRKYFVIDILRWNKKTLLDCETEFRFYWMETKFQQDVPDAMEVSARNPFPFSVLPYRNCTVDVVGEILNGAETAGGSLDGLLFFHKQTHYTAGSTPLVGWLKAHMVPEILGVEVHPKYLEERPSDYENLVKYIKKTEEIRRAKRNARQRRNMQKEVKMEAESICNMSSPEKSPGSNKPSGESELDTSITEEQNMT